jgi:hypothetical protein
MSIQSGPSIPSPVSFHPRNHGLAFLLAAASAVSLSDAGASSRGMKSSTSWKQGAEEKSALSSRLSSSGLVWTWYVLNG